MAHFEFFFTLLYVDIQRMQILNNAFCVSRRAMRSNTAALVLVAVCALLIEGELAGFLSLLSRVLLFCGRNKLGLLLALALFLN